MTGPPQSTYTGPGQPCESLSRELAEFKHALDASAIVSTTDAAGVITYVNDRFCEITKFDREELIGQNHRIVSSGHHGKEFWSEMWRTITSGRVWRNELKNRAKDGSFHWVDTTIVPFLDASGRPYQYIAIRYDITEKKRLEQELVRAAQISLIGELAAGLAHEIKNPLASIQGVVDILLRNRKMKAEERDALESVRNEVSRIDSTICALLEHARPRPLNPATASLDDAVRHAVTLAREAAAIRSSNHGDAIQVEFEEPESPIHLRIDAAQIADAVLQLIKNGIEALGSGGRIVVRLGCATNGDRHEATIEVRDSGHGIPDSDLNRIFYPFFTTRETGTGLGLPAVRRIVRAHGGRVDVTETSNRGTTFTVALPFLNGLK